MPPPVPQSYAPPQSGGQLTLPQILQLRQQMMGSPFAAQQAPQGLGQVPPQNPQAGLGGQQPMSDATILSLLRAAQIQIAAHPPAPGQPVEDHSRLNNLVKQMEARLGNASAPTAMNTQPISTGLQSLR